MISSCRANSGLSNQCNFIPPALTDQNPRGGIYQSPHTIPPAVGYDGCLAQTRLMRACLNFQVNALHDIKWLSSRLLRRSKDESSRTFFLTRRLLLWMCRSSFNFVKTKLNDRSLFLLLYDRHVCVPPSGIKRLTRYPCGLCRPNIM